MDNIFLNENFDNAFAIAWNENQGEYSLNIAKKTLNFAKTQGLKINSVLDICCGSANFLNEFAVRGINCTGTEILDSYISYNKANYKNMEFFKTNTLLDFDQVGKYDLISCNHDMINTLSTIEEWETMFKKVYEHLNNGGMFIFDFYTKRKLQYWNEVTYDENEKLDYIKNVVCDGNSKTSISNIYYINLNPQQKQHSEEKDYQFNNYENKYKRIEDTSVEYYFDNKDILDAIKRSGYRYLITTDANFNPVSSIEDMNRMHIIAIKREK